MDDKHIVYRLFQDKHYLTWTKFYESIKLSINSIYDIITVLKSISFESYYLEFNPVSWNLLEETLFEFVIIKTSSFIRKTDIGIKLVFETKSQTLIRSP
jgi:hypothetical protein